MVACFQIFVAQPDNRQDRAAAIGLGNRVDARIKPRADERFDSGQRQLLEFRIGQINHLGHEIAAHYLVEVLFRKLNRDWRVSQVRIRTRRDGSDLQ